MQAATLHATRGVDELCILDIAATKEGRRHAPLIGEHTDEALSGGSIWE